MAEEGTGGASAGSIGVMFVVPTRDAIQGFREFTTGLNATVENAKRQVADLTTSFSGLKFTSGLRSGTKQLAVESAAAITSVQTVAAATQTSLAATAAEATKTADSMADTWNNLTRRSMESLVVTGARGAAAIKGLASATQTATTQFGLISSSIQKFSTQVALMSGNAAKNIGDLRKSISTVQLALTAGLGAGVLKLGADFDRAITNVRAVTKESEVAFEDTRKRVLSISRELGVAGDDAANALFGIVSSGIRGESAIRTLEAGIKGARAGLIDLKLSTDVLVGTLNAFSLSGSEAENVMGKLLKAVDIGIFTFEELASNLGTVSPIAASAGLSLEELLGILGQLTLTGLSFAESATQVRGAIAGLIKPDKEASEIIRKVLGTTAELSIKTIGFSKTLEKLVQSTRGSNEALAEIFPNIRALQGVISLASSGFGDLAANVKALGEADAGNLAATLDIQAQSFGTLAKSIADTIRTDIQTFFNDNREAIVGATAAVLGFIRENKGLIVGLAQLTLGISAVAAAGLAFKITLFGLEGGLKAVAIAAKVVTAIFSGQLIASFAKGAVAARAYAVSLTQAGAAELLLTRAKLKTFFASLFPTIGKTTGAFKLLFEAIQSGSIRASIFISAMGAIRQNAGTGALAINTLKLGFEGLKSGIATAVVGIGGATKAIAAFAIGIAKTPLGIAALVTAVATLSYQLGKSISPWQKAKEQAEGMERVLKRLETPMNEFAKSLMAGTDPLTGSQSVSNLEELSDLQRQYADALVQTSKGSGEAARTASVLRTRIKELSETQADDLDLIRERIAALNSEAQAAVPRFREILTEELFGGREIKQAGEDAELLAHQLETASKFTILSSAVSPESATELANLEALLKNLEQTMGQVDAAASANKRDMTLFADSLELVDGVAAETSKNLAKLVETMSNRNLREDTRLLPEIDEDKKELAELEKQLKDGLQDAFSGVIPIGEITEDDIANLFPNATPEFVSSVLFGKNPEAALLEAISGPLLEVRQKLRSSGAAEDIIDHASVAELKQRFSDIGIALETSQSAALLNVFKTLEQVASGYAELEKEISRVQAEELQERQEAAADVESELLQFRIDRLKSEGKELEAGILANQRRYEDERREILETGKLAEAVAKVRAELARAESEGNTSAIEQFKRELQELTNLQTRAVDALAAARSAADDEEAKKEKERQERTEEGKAAAKKAEKEKELADLREKRRAIELALEHAKKNDLVREEISLKSQLEEVESDIARVTEKRIEKTEDLAQLSKDTLRDMEEQLRIARALQRAPESQRDILRDAQSTLAGTDDPIALRGSLRDRFREAESVDEAKVFGGAIADTINAELQSLAGQRQRALAQRQQIARRGGDTSEIDEFIRGLNKEIVEAQAKLHILSEAFIEASEEIRRQAEFTKARERAERAGLSEDEARLQAEKQVDAQLEPISDSQRTRIEENLRKNGRLAPDETVLGRKDGELVIGKNLELLEAQRQNVEKEKTILDQEAENAARAAAINTAPTAPGNSSDAAGEATVGPPVPQELVGPEAPGNAFSEIRQQLTASIQSLSGAVSQFVLQLGEFMSATMDLFGVIESKLVEAVDQLNLNTETLRRQQQSIDALRIANRPVGLLPT